MRANVGAILNSDTQQNKVSNSYLERLHTQYYAHDLLTDDDLDNELGEGKKKKRLTNL